MTLEVKLGKMAVGNLHRGPENARFVKGGHSGVLYAQHNSGVPSRATGRFIFATRGWKFSSALSKATRMLLKIGSDAKCTLEDRTLTT